MTQRWERVVGAVLHPITEWKVTRAKDLHRRAHPECAATGCPKDPTTGKANDVHHIIPVHVRPDLACDPDNLITLTRTMHWVIGHRGESWKAHDPQVCEKSSQIRKILVDIP